MIHPSYRELMDKINEENAAENIPGITSRYSVVLATSKRAREITNGAEPLAYAKSGKALSVAVEEFFEGKVRMNPEGSMQSVEEASESDDGTEAAAEAAEEISEEVTDAAEESAEAEPESPEAESSAAPEE